MTLVLLGGALWVGVRAQPLPPVRASTIRLVVAPGGDDGAPGTAEQPLATLAGARDRARARRSEEGCSGAAVEVTVQAGTYPLREPFVLEEADGGSDAAPVIYQAAAGAQVNLVGGVEIPPAAFRAVEDAAVLARLPEASRGKVRCADLGDLVTEEFRRRPDRYRNFISPELFIDGERMTLARYPNEGWLTFTGEQVIDPGPIPRRGGATDQGGGTFEYTDPRVERWSTDAGVWLYGYWCWDWYGETCRVASIDPDRQHIVLAVPHQYGIGPSAEWNTAPRRYYALNLLEELDLAGEWYLDVESKRLYVYPPEDFSDSRVVLSVGSETMIQIDGARHVQLRGFVIECGQSSAFSLGGSDNLIADCEIRNMGQSGGSLRGERNGLRRCHLHHLGAAGVGTSSGDRRILRHAGNYVEDCHIHDYGIHQRTYAPAIGLRGCGNRASHNLIHHAPHTAIEYSGNDNIIEYNEIHHVLLETSDAGALYTGRDWSTYGNIIRHNFIHQLGGFGVGGGFAVYVDDQDSGDTVVGNVLYQAGKGIFFSGGRSNIAENNLIVDCAAAFTLTAVGVRRAPDGDAEAPYDEGSTLMKRLRAVPYEEEPWRSRYPRLVGLLDDEPRQPKYNVIRDNLIVNSPPGLLPSREAEAACWQDPANRNVVATNYITDEDPGFVDLGNLDFSLRWDSPVWKEHPTFRRIPFAEIGPRSTLPTR